MPEANRKKGEVKVTFPSKTIIIEPSLENIAVWEDLTGKHWIETAQVFSSLLKNPETASMIYSHIKINDMLDFFTILCKEDIDRKEIAEQIEELGVIDAGSVYAVAMVECIIPPSQRKEVEDQIKKQSKSTAKTQKRKPRKTTQRKSQSY